MKDGINEAINLLQPLDFTSGDYIKRFFGKIHFYQKNLVGVWEIMFEQCPYFPIPNIPNPPNIMPVYNTWLESVNAQVVDADFVKISQLWLRQIGTWEEYELNFFKWYQEYYQWYLDTYEFRKTLEKKFAHLVDDGEEPNTPDIAQAKEGFTKAYDTFYRQYKDERKQFFRDINQKVKEIKEHLKRIKFVLSLFYASKINELPPQYIPFCKTDIYVEIVNANETDWLKDTYIKWRKQYNQSIGLSDEQTLMQNEGIDEFHLQREFCFECWRQCLEGRIKHEQECFTKLVGVYTEFLNRKVWIPEDKRAKLHQDFEKFKQLAAKVLETWAPDIFQEVKIMYVSLNCSHRKKLTDDYDTRKLARYLTQEQIQSLPALTLDDKESDGSYKELVINFRQKYPTLFDNTLTNYWWLQQFLEWIPGYIADLINPIYEVGNLSQVFNKEEIVQAMTVASNQILTLDQDKKQLANSIAQQDQQIQDLRTQIDELIQFKAAAEESQNQIIKLNSEIQKLTNQIIQANNEKELAYKEKEEAYQKTIELLTKQEQLQKQNTALETEVEESHNRNAAINDKLNLKEQELLQVKQAKEQIQADLNEVTEVFEKELETQRGQIFGFQISNQQKDEENQKLVEELKQLTIIINQKESEINDLQRLQNEQLMQINQANQSTQVVQELQQRIKNLLSINQSNEHEIVQLKKTIEQK